MKKTTTAFLALLWLPYAFCASVCYPPKADAALEFAAKDMAEHLSKITGKTYQARQGASGSSSEGDIVLEHDPALQSQQWHFKTVDGRLFLRGGDVSGIVYGVYTFLEKYAGCAWLAPDTAILPGNPAWKLPALDQKGRPAFLRREMYVGRDYIDGIWRLRNKENERAAFGVNLLPGRPNTVHSFGNYARALRNRPELFGPSVSGRKCTTLCMTNPQVSEIVLKELEKYIAEDRAIRKGKPVWQYPVIYEISQPDGGSGGECWCDGCRTLALEEGSYSGPNLAFVNRLAVRIAEKYPEIQLRTLAYSYTKKAPKKIVAADNVIVQFCAGSPFEPLVKGNANGSELEKWALHAKQKAVWSYWRTYQGTLYPLVKKRSDISAEVRFCRDQGVIHYYAEAEEPLSRAFAMLQHWLLLKMLEDPDRDIRKLTDTFLKGYYGKAAPEMLRYLEYLENHQEPSREFLNREFFEQVNALLDQAEKRTADDAPSRQHVNWERVVVDRAMYHRLGILLRQGYVCDRQKILKRFTENSLELIQNWKGFQWQEKEREKRLLQARREAELFSYFPVKIPDRFQGSEVVDMHWNQIPLTGKVEYVRDPDAVCGMAFRCAGEAEKLPYNVGFYFGPRKYGESLTITETDIPDDEKFHLYKLGRTTVMAPLLLHFNHSWTVCTYLPTVGIIPSEWDIWVSMKFAGPRYVKGSKAQNAILFDRILLVKDPDPLREYETPDPAENRIRNGSFEQFSNSKWIPGWGKAGKNCVIDRKEKHTGKASLKIGNVPDTYTALAAGLGRIEDWNSDLLIRGWCKYENLQNVNGSLLPFVGLWTNTRNGANSYKLPVATFYPGSRDWTRFETIVRAEEFKKKLLRYPADKRPFAFTFRINLSRQPGTVWLDDVEVLPLKKKCGRQTAE